MRTPLRLASSLFAVSLFACGGETPAPATPTSGTTVTTSPPASGAGAGASSALTPSGSAGSKKAERRTNPAWATCHSTYKPTATDDLSADVDKMAKACASTTKMHVVGDTFKGTQTASNVPQSFKFKAQASHCYRAYAAAAPGITDLDLLIKDSTGAVAGEDSTEDPTPVVMEDGAVCFSADDDASVVVSVGAGGGGYAIQVWSD
jgi:hypothetical protein